MLFEGWWAPLVFVCRFCEFPVNKSNMWLVRTMSWYPEVRIKHDYVWFKINVTTNWVWIWESTVHIDDVVIWPEGFVTNYYLLTFVHTASRNIWVGNAQLCREEFRLWEGQVFWCVLLFSETVLVSRMNIKKIPITFDLVNQGSVSHPQ